VETFFAAEMLSQISPSFTVYSREQWADAAGKRESSLGVGNNWCGATFVKLTVSEEESGDGNDCRSDHVCFDCRIREGVKGGKECVERQGRTRRGGQRGGRGASEREEDKEEIKL
jgi:hypothetical protein